MNHSSGNGLLFKRTLLAAAACIGLVLIAVQTPAAQPTGSVTFDTSTTSANGTLVTRLTWASSPAGALCEASGDPNWTGQKPASGTLDLPAITKSGTYLLTLSCVWPGTDVAAISWLTPTKNTDGGELARCASQTSTGPCLKGFKIYHGTAANNLDDVRSINDGSATRFDFSGLAPGQHFFSITAINGNDVESEPSGVGSKTATASVIDAESITLTVNPKPQQVSGFAIDGVPVQ